MTRLMLPLLLALQAMVPATVQAQPATAAPVTTIAMPPHDWSELPELELRRRWTEVGDLSAFVRDEVLAGRCAVEGNEISVELAVLVSTRGEVRRIVPRAIDCPTVEQYASGLLSRMARDNVAAPREDSWHRAVLVFAW